MPRRARCGQFGRNYLHLQILPNETTMHDNSLSPPFAVLHPAGEASLRNLPVNLFGSVMGLSGLALAWRLAHESLAVPAFVGEAIGFFSIAVFVLLGLAYAAKLAMHPQAVRAEFLHPITGNFFGTIAISMLLVSAVVAPHSTVAAHVLWTLGAIATFVLGFVVVSRLLNGQVDASHAVPAWLIPGVATLDIAVTAGRDQPLAWAAELNLLAMAVGAVFALVLLVLIVGRLVHQAPLAPAMTPSLMILVAPFAVGFLAYTNMMGGIDRFAALLFYFALFMFAVIAPKVFRRSNEFSPGWWAISFPMAALANAALKYAQLRATTPLWALAILLLGVLTFALLLLTVRTLRIALNGKLFT